MGEDIRLSFKGIWSHKLRSFLTMLGIIVGVAAVIAVVSTINGTNEQIKNNLIGDGSRTVTVELYQNGWTVDFSYQSIPDGIPMVSDDTKEALKEINGVEQVSVFHKRNYMDSLYYRNTALQGDSVLGIDENYLNTAGLQLVSGRAFSEADQTGFKKYALIDRKLWDAAWNGEDPIGTTVDIQGEPFLVIGMVEKKQEYEPVITSVYDYEMYSGETNGSVYIPDAMWPLPFCYDEPSSVLLRAASVDDMTTIGKEAADLLNQTLTTGDNGDITYQSTNLADEASQMQQLSASANVLLIGVASISLLVGGIGVMNIMLVSVTERTREIGLKKALGARRRRIRRQFLTEAVILSGMGGIFGVLTGIILSRIISAVALIPVSISLISILISVVFSMVIGIVFGMAPAAKASKLNPIEALRYE